MNEYEIRLIAFIDLLGFKSLIKNPRIETGIAATNDPLENITNALKILHSEMRWEEELDNSETAIQYENSEEKDRQVSIFSDSVIISYKINMLQDCLEELLHKLVITQLQLFKYGVLLRGGITIGELMHQEELCFGPGMLKAYYLESKIAINPRIIIDDTIFEQENYKETDFLNILMSDTDDNLKSVNTFNFFKENHLRYESLNNYFPFWEITTLIETNIVNRNKKVRKKYKWLADEYNGFLDGIKEKFGIPDDEIHLPGYYIETNKIKLFINKIITNKLYSKVFLLLRGIFSRK